MNRTLRAGRRGLAVKALARARIPVEPEPPVWSDDDPVEPVDGTAFDFRQARVIGSTRLDHALTGLSRGADGRAWAYLAAPGGPRVGPFPRGFSPPAR